MTYNELNAFILNYLKNDITGRAIMLTGEWGSGKSYYIKNTLKPFLATYKHKCAVVSLYGLTDVSEISKAIYVELRTIKKATESEVGNTAKVVGKIVGKTLINGLVSKIGFDIGNISEDDFQKVYDSIDLSEKLIILEDVERTHIDMVVLLGYINNMCENDGVKVLLVTNENELIHTYTEITEEGNHIERYTEKTAAYKRAKEKTVGDTIKFECDYPTTIQQIIKSFGDALEKFHNQEYAEDVFSIFVFVGSCNLRAFIYACQKSKEIFNFIEKEQLTISDEIAEKIFLGVVAFTQRLSQGAELEFDKNTYISGDLGVNEVCPLFRFCYNYLINQVLSREDVFDTVKYYNNYYKHSEWNSGRDKDIRTIKDFQIHTEKEVADAILNLPRKLLEKQLPYCDYGVLINCLIAIKYDAKIDIKIEPIEKNIIENLKEAEVSFESLFNSVYTLYDADAIEAFNSFKDKIKAMLSKHDSVTFPYEPDLINDFCTKNTSKLNATISQTGFMHTIDINRFIEMLKNCSSEQISNIRSLILTLYRTKSREQVLEDDIWALNELSDKIAVLLDYNKYDKIQKMQLKWLSKNLSDIVCIFN